MTKDDLHHPVTNGKTKLMVFMALIFIFIITLTSLCFAFGATFGLTGLAMWGAKCLFGSISITGLGALVSVTRKFFDTRTSEIKAKDKLNLKKENHKYKMDKLKFKHNKKNNP